MDFVKVFNFLLSDFKQEKIDCALIGGFGLQALGITRTTGDIDLLINRQDTQKAKKIMKRQGYRLLHESGDVLNFSGQKIDLGRVDFLLAHRKYALGMLERAKNKKVFGGKFQIKALTAEDQVGLKVQSSSNDPQRLHRDMADIEQIISDNYSRLDIGLLREYFRLFEREGELDAILKKVKHA